MVVAAPHTAPPCVSRSLARAGRTCPVVLCADKAFSSCFKGSPREDGVMLSIIFGGDHRGDVAERR